MEYTKRWIYLQRLQRDARIYVGVPEKIEPGERFPVLYMHDGHNVFSDEDAFAGVSWDIIGAYQRYTDLPRIIVVALECASGGDRFDEYSGFEIRYPGLEALVPAPVGGKGDLYLETVVSEIKPMIDQQYPTLPDRAHTGMMGASMGGVITHYAALTRGDVFSRFGSLSGAFFVSEQAIVDATEKADLSHVERFYLAVGDRESGIEEAKAYVHTNQVLFNALSQKLPHERLHFEVIEGGIHHETAWAEQLPDAIRFLFGNNAAVGKENRV